jgi:hypothetical protein
MQNEPGCPTDQQCVPRPTRHGVIIALQRPVLCRPLRWPVRCGDLGPGHLTLGGDAGDLLDVSSPWAKAQLGSYQRWS